MPLSDLLAKRLSPSRAYFTYAFPLSFSPSLSPTKVTFSLMELFLFLDAQNMSRYRTSTLSDRVKEQKLLLGCLVRRGIDFRGCDRVDAHFGPPPENHALVERVNNSRTRFQYFIFHVQFFFSIYILI